MKRMTVNGRVVSEGDVTDLEGKGGSKLKFWKPRAHTADLWSSDNLSCPTHRAALRSAKVTALQVLKRVTASTWGRQ